MNQLTATVKKRVPDSPEQLTNHCLCVRCAALASELQRGPAVRDAYRIATFIGTKQHLCTAVS